MHLLDACITVHAKMFVKQLNLKIECIRPIFDMQNSTAHIDIFNIQKQNKNDKKKADK